MAVIMPGILPHLLAGCAMFFIGRYYFKGYFIGENKLQEQLILLVVCIFFSFFPDIPLGFYYLTHILSFNDLLPYHIFFHIILIPISIGIIIIFKYGIEAKREAIWITGLFSVLLHIAMDILISDTGVLI